MTFKIFLNFINIKRVTAGCWWLTLILIATWDSEIGRTVMPGQPGQKVCKNPSQQKNLGMVAHTCHPSEEGRLKYKDSSPGWPG
jgi:hypothetical protein